ncbi:MFS transporter [Streptomyces iranensis]|uniref:Drug resistance transporter EmrB/QacA subfamilyprotein n=1 Tax=Streptomyces iranensis TaxID=576784 RepID=A0A061A9Z8_9ACTN|nr:MFS transporter [Streptomyces iranensis]MBP2064132.1 EmrB/QacA subfamily drug resistance transporter [Streptomyces iranensis]CDR17193.1 drug resistance transporter EmrB/QacA subfamilyprotein [Streptomyces iranensis]
MSSPRGRRLTLVASVTGAVIVALDGTVLTVAQPRLQRDLHATFAQVQWTSTGYLIAVASLLVFAGRLGDRYGHRRVFALGMLGFGAASAGIGLAGGIGWVIGLRVAQGVFGALLQPATLGMLRAAYPPERLGRPVAVRTGAIGLAAVAGPLVGGALTTHLGWRAVFFVNVAPALAMGLAALAVRAPSALAVRPPAAPRETARPRLDLPGAGLLAVALAGLVHTLVGIPETGWTVATALGLGCAVSAGGVFVRHERRTADPLVPPGVLRSGTAGPALGVLVAASAALFGALFLGTYYLQDVLALDPFDSGLRALPLAVMMVLGAPVAALLTRRQGPRRTAVAGMVLVAAGVLLMSRLGRGSGAEVTGGCFLLLGAGFATVMVTATTVVVRDASVDTAGVAGGLQQTAMNIGPALGVAAATTLMSVAGRGDTAGRPPGDGPRWAADVFLSAMGPALTVLAAVAAAGVLPATRLPGRAAARRPGDQPVEELPDGPPRSEIASSA